MSTGILQPKTGRGGGRGLSVLIRYTARELEIAHIIATPALGAPAHGLLHMPAGGGGGGRGGGRGGGGCGGGEGEGGLGGGGRGGGGRRKGGGG